LPLLIGVKNAMAGGVQMHPKKFKAHFLVLEIVFYTFLKHKQNIILR